MQYATSQQTGIPAKYALALDIVELSIQNIEVKGPLGMCQVYASTK